VLADEVRPGRSTNEEKGYATPYLADGRKLVKIGVSFSTKSRTIEEWRAVD
jgi:hypothetical protein